MVLDNLMQFWEFRHALSTKFAVQSERQVAPQHHVPVFTPPRDLLAAPMVPGLDMFHHDHIIDERHHQAAMKKAYGLTKQIASGTVLVFIMLAILYTVASLIFGHHHDLHCLQQQIPHGWIDRGWRDERPVSHCDSGFTLGDVYSTLRCRVIQEHCFISKRGTVYEEAKETCERTWTYTTAELAEAARNNGTSADRAAARAASESLCVPLTSRLYMRGYRISSPRGKPISSAAPASSVWGLVLFSVGAVVLAGICSLPRQLHQRCSAVQHGTEISESPQE